MNFIVATCGARRANALRGLRALQGKQPAGKHRLDLAGRGEMLVDVREIVVLAGALITSNR